MCDIVSDSIRAGVTVMAKTIASDLAPFGVTVKNIAPGPNLTDRITEIFSARAKRSGMARHQPLDLRSLERVAGNQSCG